MESDKFVCVRETGAQNQLVRAGRRSDPGCKRRRVLAHAARVGGLLGVRRPLCCPAWRARPPAQCTCYGLVATSPPRCPLAR